MIESENQRREYLNALGIDVWVPRDSPEPQEGPPAAAATSVATEEMDWDSLRACVAQCTDCELANSRTQTVFGVGDRTADWLVVGEAPGAEEDRRGEPFVGRAGKLLDEMLRAIGQDRERVFIANILKCRPPNNRDPKTDEAAACRGYLDRQIALVQPKVILAAGRIAAQQLLQTDEPVGKLRGRQHMLGDVPVIVTYHPAYLLRSPVQKRKSWDDLCRAMRVVQDGVA